MQIEREKIKVKALQDIELCGKVIFKKDEEFEVEKYYDYFYFKVPNTTLKRQINSEWVITI